MDTKRLKKTILFESAVLGGVLGILALFAYFLDDYGESLAQQGRQLESEANGITGQIASLREKYAKVKNSGEIYQEVLDKKNHNELAIDRDMMKDRFNQFKDTYYLSDIRLVVSPVEEVAGSKYKRQSANIIASDVNINFSALDDEYVYQLIHAMQSGLPGGNKIFRMTLSRPQPLSDEMLRQIRQKGAFGIMHGEIDFTWYGIKTNDDAPAKKP